MDKTEAERIEDIKTQFGEYGKYMRFPDPSKITRYFKKQHISPTFIGKASLLGDSAHAQGPEAGIGFNLVLNLIEDYPALIDQYGFDWYKISQIIDEKMQIESEGGYSIR